jgi:O-antigen biosynthesis protein
MEENVFSRYLSKGFRIIRTRGVKAIINPIVALEEFAEANHHVADIKLLEMIDYCDEDLIRNSQLMENFNQVKNLEVKTVNWFVPPFMHAFGGIYTILRLAEYFSSKKQINNRFIFYGENQNIKFKETVSEPFPTLSNQQTILLKNNEVDKLPYADISIATRWDSAPLVMRFNKTQGKFYFIQDYEPLFYPASSLYASAEKTYKFGFHGIINTPGLFDIYTKEYGGQAEYFIPAVDTKVFYPSNRQVTEPSAEKPFTIFFYARPEAPRNGFELGVAALRNIKAKYGTRVLIFTAGSLWNPKDYGLENVITTLGVLPYKETANLYRKTDIGLVFMFTKHPSYLPFELMACGCPVITNKNPANSWFLKDEDNCLLTEPSITCIYEKIDKLMTNTELRKHLTISGIKSISGYQWENQMEKIYKFITKQNQRPRM